MWMTTDDFRIKAENFDLTNGYNVLRIMCGAFLIPHIIGKFAAGGLNAGIVGFFAKAGFQPPEVWVLIAATAEIVATITMILGICTRFAALGTFALLLTTVYALQVAKGFGWTWNTGGYEYPVFWALTSAVVAMQAWKVALKRPTAVRAPAAITLAA